MTNADRASSRIITYASNPPPPQAVLAPAIVAAAASAEGDLARQAAGSALQPVSAQAVNGTYAPGPPLNQGGHHQPPAAVSPGSFEMQSSLLALAHGSFPNEPMQVRSHLSCCSVCANGQDELKHQAPEASHECPFSRKRALSVTCTRCRCGQCSWPSRNP